MIEFILGAWLGGLIMLLAISILKSNNKGE